MRDLFHLALRPFGAHPGAVSISEMLSSLIFLNEFDVSYSKFDLANLLIIVEAFFFPRLFLLRSINLAMLYLDDSVVEPLLAALLPIWDLRFLNISSDKNHLSEASLLRRRTALMAEFPRLHLILTKVDLPPKITPKSWTQCWSE